MSISLHPSSSSLSLSLPLVCRYHPTHHRHWVGALNSASRRLRCSLCSTEATRLWRKKFTWKRIWQSFVQRIKRKFKGQTKEMDFKWNSIGQKILVKCINKKFNINANSIQEIENYFHSKANEVTEQDSNNFTSDILASNSSPQLLQTNNCMKLLPTINGTTDKDMEYDGEMSSGTNNQSSSHSFSSIISPPHFSTTTSSSTLHESIISYTSNISTFVLKWPRGCTEEDWDFDQVYLTTRKNE